MTKAAILTVDDDVAVSQAITRDLRSRYGADYQIVRATSGAEALKVLSELALRERRVALIASDQRMPEMTGVEFLEKSRRQTPDAKLVLLTAYADTEVAIKAINDIGLDYYLLKPWDPPTECISRRIVIERHGGEIKISSKPGETALRVRLPRNRPTTSG
jgi:thioredoxin reductase (NADPH)